MMFCVDSTTSIEYTKERSVFLAYLMPSHDYEAQLSALQKEHKKASHFVRATRRFNEYSRIIESFSDDGEPKGSSGVPVLNVMRGNELVECAIIVVRYFGGTLLGIGGLVRAYSKASLLVVQAADLLPFEPQIEVRLECPFNKVETLKYMCERMKIEILGFEFTQNFAIIRMKAAPAKIDEVKARI